MPPIIFRNRISRILPVGVPSVYPCASARLCRWLLPREGTRWPCGKGPKAALTPVMPSNQTLGAPSRAGIASPSLSPGSPACARGKYHCQRVWMGTCSMVAATAPSATSMGRTGAWGAPVYTKGLTAHWWHLSGCRGDGVRGTTSGGDTHSPAKLAPHCHAGFGVRRWHGALGTWLEPSR